MATDYSGREREKEKRFRGEPGAEMGEEVKSEVGGRLLAGWCPIFKGILYQYQR